MKYLILIAFLFSVGKVHGEGMPETEPRKFGHKLIFDKSFGDAQKAQLAQIIRRVGELELTDTTPLFRKLFGSDQMGKVLETFLKSVDRFYYEVTDEPMIVAYYSSSRNGVVLTNHFFSDQTGLLDTFSTLIHEAVHAKSPRGAGHVNCPENSLSGEKIVGWFTGKPLEGLPGCDLIPGGAYGVQSVLLFNLSEFCSTCSENDRNEAAFISDSLLERIVYEGAFELLVEDRNLSKI